MPDGHCLNILLFWWRSTAALVFRVGACFEVSVFCPPFPWPVSEAVACGLCLWLWPVAYVCGCGMWPMSVAVACGLCMWLWHVAYICGCGLWPMYVAVACGLCLRL